LALLVTSAAAITFIPTFHPLRSDFSASIGSWQRAELQSPPGAPCADVMTLDHHVARRVLRKPSSSPSYPGWISDSIHAESAQRISRLFLRRGSSVPGPLEARKRAARRKNTCLASAARIGPPIETGALSALGGKVEWWNVSRLFEPRTGAAEREALNISCSAFDTHRITAASKLPAWLTGETPTSQQSSVPSQQASHDGHICSEEISATRPSADQFHHLLPQCQSLQDIRGLIQRLEINLMQNPAHSRHILKHLLDCDSNLSQLEDFFLDGKLHVQGSACVGELLGWLGSKPQAEAQLKSFHVCLQKCLHLGLLSGQDIRMILNKLATVEIDLQGSTTRFGDTEAIQEWYSMMVDALNNCPIFTLSDVGGECVHKWLSCVTEAPFALCAFDTFHLLQQHLATSDAIGFKVNTVRGLVRKWISHVQGVRKKASPVLAQSLQEFKVAAFLTALQPIVVSKSVRQITEKLVRDVLRGSRQPSALELWMNTLSLLPSWSTSIILQQRSWREDLGDEASTSAFSLRQRIIVRLWTITRLTDKAPKPEHLQESEKLIQLLVRLFEQQLKLGEDLLAAVIFSVQSLPLPFPSAVLNAIVNHSAGGLHIHGSIKKLQGDMLKVSASRLDTFKDDKVYRNAKINMISYVRQLAERVNTDPEAFLQLAQHLIMKDKLSIKIITRILQHNLQLNLSLAYAAAPSPELPEQPQTTTSSMTTTTTTVPISPTLALHIINTLARAFALSPILTPRQSFRKVHWLYLHLHRHTGGTAIGPEFTRALWHAGVTRYRDTGTSPDKVEWILGKVREVEGHKVADRLLWFGARGVEGWEKWTQKGPEGVERRDLRRVVKAGVGGGGGD
jgi:hypothetical protein